MTAFKDSWTHFTAFKQGMEAKGYQVTQKAAGKTRAGLDKFLVTVFDASDCVDQLRIGFWLAAKGSGKRIPYVRTERLTDAEVDAINNPVKPAMARIQAMDQADVYG